MVPLIIIGATLMGVAIGSGLTYWSMLIVGLRHARAEAKRAPVSAPAVLEVPPLPPLPKLEPIEAMCPECRQSWTGRPVHFEVGPERYMMDDDGGLREVLELPQDIKPELAEIPAVVVEDEQPPL